MVTNETVNRIANANVGVSTVAGVPKGLNIPAGYHHKILKETTDGTGRHTVHYCKTRTLTPDCVKIDNNLNVNNNYIAKTGGVGKKGPGGMGGRVRRR